MALLLVLVAIVAGRGGGSGTTTATDGGLAHVHGLGIDPGDGTLYAASHTGVFRVPETGKATRIADRYQDTMGFTVVGPRHFLASGHPALDDESLRRPGRPPLLGLVESTDAGRTWSSLSLLGESDFHALVYAHDRVYGFDATNGRFMVSDDKRTWQTRSQTRIGTFAVDPDDALRIVASTESGLAESRDGGATWRGLQGPQLLFLAWDAEGGLWGAAPDGAVFRHDTASGAWETQGTLPGPPQALLVRGPDLYAAAEAGDVTAVYRSTDDGRTWRLRYRDKG